MNNKMTFLTAEQVFEKPIDLIKKYGTRSEITDFCILLGSFVSNDKCFLYKSDKPVYTGSWWTKTRYHSDAYYVRRNGKKNTYITEERIIGSRPALPYSLMFLFSTNVIQLEEGIKEVEYGEYPQTIVSEELSEYLENAYINNTLNETGRFFTTDSTTSEYFDTPFKAKHNIVYEYNGKKYIRFIPQSNCKKSGVLKQLSNGKICTLGTVYWVEVEPIKWLVDENANIALSKKVIFSGVQYSRNYDCKRNFENTDINKFMNEIFSKEIITYEEKIKLITQGLLSNSNNNILNLLDDNEKIIFNQLLKLEQIEEAYQYAMTRITKKITHIIAGKEQGYQKKL